MQAPRPRSHANPLHPLSNALSNTTHTDRVFDEATRTEHMYSELARSVITSAMEGVNGTIFAYGQTASGKTHTMQGSRDEPGIIRLAIRDIFDYVQTVRPADAPQQSVTELTRGKVHGPRVSAATASSCSASRTWKSTTRPFATCSSRPTTTSRFTKTVAYAAYPFLPPWSLPSTLTAGTLWTRDVGSARNLGREPL